MVWRSKRVCEVDQYTPWVALRRYFGDNPQTTRNFRRQTHGPIESHEELQDGQTCKLRLLLCCDSRDSKEACN